MNSVYSLRTGWRISSRKGSRREGGGVEENNTCLQDIEGDLPTKVESGEERKLNWESLFLQFRIRRVFLSLLTVVRSFLSFRRVEEPGYAFFGG